MGRWGGEEFIVLARDADRDKVVHFAERFRADFEALQWEHGGANHTVSVGVTGIRRGESADAALSRVDQALYLAKRNGKNQVVVLD